MNVLKIQLLDHDYVVNDSSGGSYYNASFSLLLADDGSAFIMKTPGTAMALTPDEYAALKRWCVEASK